MSDIHGRRINLRGLLLRTAAAIRSNLRTRSGRWIFTTFKQKHFHSVSMENMKTSSRCCELLGFEPLYREKRCEERGDHGPYQGLIEQEREEAFMNIAGVNAESWTSAHIYIFEMNVFASSGLSSGVLLFLCHVATFTTPGRIIGIKRLFLLPVHTLLLSTLQRQRSDLRHISR